MTTPRKKKPGPWPAYEPSLRRIADNGGPEPALLQVHIVTLPDGETVQVRYRYVVAHPKAGVFLRTNDYARAMHYARLWRRENEKPGAATRLEICHARPVDAVEEEAPEARHHGDEWMAWAERRRA